MWEMENRRGPSVRTGIWTPRDAGGSNTITKGLTGREGDEESPGHEQDVQNHQPGITCGQLFVGAHPHPCVLRPVRWRGRRVQFEIFLLVPFELCFPVMRVSVIMLSSDCESQRENEEEMLRKVRGTLHPRKWQRKGREGRRGDEGER